MKLEKIYSNDNALLLLDIVNKAFPDRYMSPADLGKLIASCNCALKVMKTPTEPVGLVLVKITTATEITMLCVTEESQRQGYGSYALRHVNQLAVNSGMSVVARVDERNLPAQKFLKKNGFVCNVLLTKKNKDGNDVYHFEYTQEPVKGTRKKRRHGKQR